MRVCFFHEVTVLLSLAGIAALLVLFLHEVVGTGGGCGSYPPGPGVMDRFSKQLPCSSLFLRDHLGS